MDGPWFADADDAAAYLTDLLRLWTAWTLGMVALLVTRGVVAMVAGIVVIVVLVVLVRPLQRRAATVEGANEPAGGFSFGRQRLGRDVAVRELAYGRRPVVEALERTGRSSLWLWARTAVIAFTAITFLVVLGDVMRPSP